MSLVIIRQDELHTRSLNQIGKDENDGPIYELNEDGTRKEYLEIHIEDASSKMTGAVAGAVKLKDGTVYDITPHTIAVMPGHSGPVNHHIAKMLEATGKLAAVQGGIQAHTCTEDCGEEAD